MFFCNRYLKIFVICLLQFSRKYFYVLQQVIFFIFFSGLPTDAVTMLTHLTAFSGSHETFVKNKKYHLARTLNYIITEL